MANCVWLKGDELFPVAISKLEKVNILIDIGCGIRPQEFITPKVHICCEPWEQYVKVLQERVEKANDRTFVIIKATWAQAVEIFPEKSVDSVYLIDVIEHLPKEDALNLLKATERIARCQIAIFTPLGLMPQHHPDGKDAWGLDGGILQEHKSGWQPEDFDSNWDIYAAEEFHYTDNMGKKLEKPFGAFWAIKNLRDHNSTPPEFLVKEKQSSLPPADVIDCIIIPRVDKNVFNTWIKIRGNDGQTFNLNGEWAYSDFRKSTPITNPLNGQKLNVTLKSIFELWSGGYDFERESMNYLRAIAAGGKPGVAFTVKDSDIMGGGNLILFRYVNWLAELGIDVAVYSNSKPPEWATVKARFHHIPDPQKRYLAIEEPVIIVYSVLELPALLRFAETRNKRIIHLCQGVEDFHYFNPGDNGIDVTLPIFQVYHSLPVGRLVVSRHLQKYFKNKYNQRCYTISNGIDTSVYTPRPERLPSLKDTVRVMVSGNPEHPLKGVRDVVNAMLIMAYKMPDTKFHIINVCGGDALPYDDISMYSTNNLTYTLRCGLTPEEMKEIYHAADIYVNASWYEGFGLPTIEAMACGVPVIQVKNYGLDEIVVDGVNCLLVSASWHEQIATAIERLLTDRDLYQMLVKNGIETAKKFSLAQQYEMFLSGFERILGYTFDTKLVERKKHELLSGENTENIIMKNKRVSGVSASDPLISVLVPTYNQADYLPQSLDSLLSQTYKNWEAIVVNDGSTDATPLVLEKYAAEDSRFRVVHKKNGGVGSALNEALRNARGEWICWLSSDDLFLPSKLKIHTYGFKKHPHIKVFHTDYYILSDGQVFPSGIDYAKFIPPVELQVLKFFHTNYFNGISICIHRSVFERIGYFKENLRNGQDFDMWLRASSYYPSQFLSVKTCITRVHASSGTQISAEMGILDSARACMEFLNTNTFPMLFPMLNLQQEDDFVAALTNIVMIIASPKSFVNSGGYALALIDRLHEWLANSCPLQLKSFFNKTFEKVNPAIQNSSLPEDIKTAFESLKLSTSSPFNYEPYDPLKEMRHYAERLEMAGSNNEAKIIRKYLEQAK